MNLAIKNIVCRTRPVEFFVIIEKSYSFPSGHAMVSSSFYLTFGYILADRFNKKFIFNLSVIFAILISMSRVILGVHWLTDIIVGFVLGFLCYSIPIKLYVSGRV